ncbi:GntR family transcriptional regulator [Dubosiella muris]|uniref:GntR family transcriptional regulator n=1 Tax=Dubosiella muris TaxID=3038133 RepID=A0AC61R5G4_9FIRM|nr:GntR family transcriptional regulator [Dubosiella muris]TGY65246.1 GntR family transcriptional regulator [Dubosiella muris]
MEKLKSKKGGKALYIQIKDIYREKILSGELKHGDKIESEMEIQKRFGVSRITARQAILDLEKEGMVNRGRGRGTFVIWKPAIKEKLSEIRSFSHEMELHGRVPGTSSFTIDREQVAEKAAKIFNLDPREEMYCLRRVRTADDVKLVYMVSYFPLDTDLPIREDNSTESMYEKFEVIGTGKPKRIEEEFSAEIPSDEVRNSLNIPKSLPVLARKRISFDEEDNIIEYTISYYRSDLYTYMNSTGKIIYQQ